MLNPVQFSSLDELAFALQMGQPVRQDHGTQLLDVAGVRYCVDYDNRSISTTASQFFFNSREQWQAAEAAAIAEEVQIATLLFCPAAAVQIEEFEEEEANTSTGRKGRRHKPRFVPIQQWQQHQYQRHQPHHHQHQQHGEQQPALTGAMAQLHLHDDHHHSAHHSHSYGHTHSHGHSHQEHSRHSIRSLRNVWTGSVAYLEAELVSFDLREMAMCGTALHYQKVDFAKRKCFSLRALSFSPQEFAALSLDELAGLIYPYAHPESHSPALLQRIGDAVQTRMISGELIEADIDSLLILYKVMAQVGFKHPCLMSLARHFGGQSLLTMPCSQDSTLNIMRAMVLHRVLAWQTGEYDDASALKELLTGFYREFEAFMASFTPTVRHEFMEHWIRLYGHHVLKLNIAQKTHLSPSPTIESNFQRHLGKYLRSHMPEIDFEDEKHLPDVLLDVDFYCEPNIIVEAQGLQMHYSLNLDAVPLDDPNPWDRSCHDRTIYLIRTNTLVKHAILKAAGYTVLATTSNHTQKIQWIVDTVRSKRAEWEQKQQRDQQWQHQQRGRQQRRPRPRPRPDSHPSQESSLPSTAASASALNPNAASFVPTFTQPSNTQASASAMPPSIPAPPHTPPPHGMQYVLGEDGYWYLAVIDPESWPAVDHWS